MKFSEFYFRLWIGIETRLPAPGGFASASYNRIYVNDKLWPSDAIRSARDREHAPLPRFR